MVDIIHHILANTRKTYSFKSTTLLAAILAGFFIYNSAVYFLLYSPAVYLIKNSVMKALEKNEYEKEIIILSISKDDIKTGKVNYKQIHEREFKLNGKMYDIKRDISDEDSLRFYCYYDKKENYFEELFSAHFEKENREKTGPVFSMIKIFPVINYFKINSENPLKIFDTGITIIHSKQKEYFTYSEIPTPPPKFV